MRVSWMEISILMAKQGLSAKQLATIAGIHVNTVYMVKKRGSATPCIVGKIAWALEVEPEQIVIYEE